MMTRLLLGSAAAVAFVLAYPTLATAENQDRPQRSTKTYQVVPVPDTAAQQANFSKIIYLNRCVGGCVIRPGNNDARANTSQIVQQTSDISEFAYSDEVWNEVVECVREVYAPFDVEVVTEDPGEDVFHHEAIVAGSPGEAGLAENVGGIAPISCRPLNNMISFSFANGSFSGGDPLNICWTVAQESAHAFGLDHVLNCYDPLTYLPRNPDTNATCGQRFFRDEEVQCGEYVESPHDCLDLAGCSNTVSTQNSHQKLMELFGPNPDAIPGPTVTIQQPASDAAVEDGFDIRFNALDVRGVSYSQLYINGWPFGEPIAGYPIDKADILYYTRAPDYPDGILNLEIKAYNDLGVVGSATVTVQKGEPCTSADTCFEGMVCNEGACAYPPPTLELGDTCDNSRQCMSMLCATAGQESHCTKDCIPGVTGTCPDGFQCLAAGDDDICWPAEGDDGGGGGCNAGGASGLSVVWLGLGLFALGLRLRKRRA